MGGCWILLEKCLNGVDYIVILATLANPNCKAHTNVFIDNNQKFLSSATHHLVELEVDRPHVVRVLGPE
jgi:hypothetical protein